MRKRPQRTDVLVYIVRDQHGRYLTRDKRRKWSAQQRRAGRFTRAHAEALALHNKATLVRLVIRLSEEEG